MRTHITIDAEIHRDLKVAAARRGLSIQKYVSDILRRELYPPRKPAPKPPKL